MFLVFSSLREIITNLLEKNCLENFQQVTVSNQSSFLSWDLITRVGSLVTSIFAVIISGTTFYLNRSAPKVRLHPGREFGVTVLRGNHLPSWGFPIYEGSKDFPYIVLAFSITISNGGGSDAVIEYMSVIVQDLTTLVKITLDWRTFFEHPVANNLPPQNVTIVTPLVIQSRSADKKLVMYLSNSKNIDKFFVENHKYKFQFSVHLSSNKLPPQKHARVVKEIIWLCSSGDLRKICSETYLPNSNPGLGSSALLSFY